MAVELKKAGERVSLQKKGGADFGEIVINLNWNTGKSPEPQAKKGLFGSLKNAFGGSGGNVDLDLGCLFELKDGTKGVVQALGNCFGSLSGPPYIALDGDDRTGASTEGENLRINGVKIPEIKRILIYTFIYEGVANWQQVDGVVTVKCPGNDDIVVRMDEYGSDKALCAIALMENPYGQTLSIEKVVRFFRSQSEADEAFNWGLRWKAGSK